LTVLDTVRLSDREREFRGLRCNTSGVHAFEEDAPRGSWTKCSRGLPRGAVRPLVVDMGKGTGILAIEHRSRARRHAGC